MFNHKVKTSTWAAALVALSVFLSRTLGLVRDRFLAGSFGAGPVLDIYFASFRLSTMIQAVFIAGGIGAVFLPIFAEEFRKNREKAFLFANNLLNISFVFFGLICIVFIISAPWLIDLIAPGFSAEQKEDLIFLSRIIMLTPILFSASSIFSGFLQYSDRFLAYGLAPIFYNLGIIGGIVFLFPLIGLSGLAWGAVIGALAHLLIQVPSAFLAGFKYQFVFTLKNYRLKKTLELMAPTALGAFFTELNITMITAIASGLTAGSISIYNLSQNLAGIPIGLVGIPFSIAFFPRLSKKWAFPDKSEFWSEFWTYLRRLVYLIFPISVLAFVLRAQIIRIILKTGMWGWEETRLSAAALGILCVSIIFLSLLTFFRKVFYCLRQAKILAFSEGLKFVLTAGLCFLFLFALKNSESFLSLFSSIFRVQGISGVEVLALPLALSLAIFIQFFFLAIVLLQKEASVPNTKIIVPSLKIFFLSLVSGASAWFSLRLLSASFSDSLLGLFAQALIAGLVGFSVYVLLSFVLKMPELKELWQEIKKEASLEENQDSLL